MRIRPQPIMPKLFAVDGEPKSYREPVFVPVGIRCSSCGGKMEVTHTVQEIERVQRRRVCDNPACDQYRQGCSTEEFVVRK